ncbi:hypothetical protein ACXR8U_32795 (plasmid) [Methylobacterium radiotolerans]|jgi:hypothetical protein
MIDASKTTVRTYTSASGLSGSAPTSSKSLTSGSSTGATAGPAAVVDLSDRAKAMIAQNRTAQDVADRLAQQAAAQRGDDASQAGSARKAQTSAGSSEAPDIYGALKSASANQSTKQTDWEAGAPYGDPTLSDADFLKNNLLADMDLTGAGWSTEDAQAFKNAIQSGTIKIQKASEIDGLNFKSWQTFTPNPNNGAGYDTTGGTTQNPTGEVKKAIDAHRGMAMWTADRGDVYLSW